MLSRTRYVCRASLVALSSLAILAAFNGPSSAQHNAMVEWAANLSPAKKPDHDAHALTVQTQAKGTVTVEVDFPHQTVTFHVDTKELSGVKKIELRAINPVGNFGGPTLFVIYDIREGPFTGLLTRTVGGPAFTSVVTPILDERAGVVISTDANPDGEIDGKITMRKRYEH
jgi:hypothetical protein